ncbi:ABC transporter substrate-binding protein [Microbacterium sp. 18062]|uniref:ABC transporter substrate-binding protein n=1 Tax=Microbacterium sp. 18062 TaxID=2681410 RepID=UPI001358C47D|nr:extracellular solute-binding protein [Microbacterium sp. 18062]
MHQHTRRRAVLPAITTLGVASLLLAGCADVAGTDDASSGSSSLFSAELITAATDRATEIADGQDLDGTTVSLIASWGGDERERFLATLEPFEEATGVTVEFTGTEDKDTIIQTNIEAGTPIDIASLTPGTLARYAETGDLHDLNELVGEDLLTESFADGFRSATTIDGANYGLWTMVDNYMLWYNPNNYDGPTGVDVTWDELTDWAADTAASGTTPWCMGLSSGATTGWPAAYFTQHLLIKQAGPEFVNALASGEASWDSPEVRAAFDLLSQVVADDETVYGGPSGILSTDPGAAHAGMYTDPANCEIEHWGTWTASMVLSSDPSLEPITDIDFLPLPTVTPEYADVDGYSGTILSAFSDRPEVAALMTYLASAEHADLIAATGNWVPANTGVDPSVYPNEILANISEEILGADTLVLFPLDAVSAQMYAQFNKTAAEFVQDPSTLDANLATMASLAAG